MAVKRQKNWLGQQRVDVPHMREIESAVAGDFDDLAGKVLASSQPIVVAGMTISMAAAVGNFATQLVLNTAGAILLHGTASEPGAVFVVSADQPAETLSTSNPNISGSFTPNAINYIGIDLVRAVDNSTDDTVKFRSATTKKEFSQQVPLARVLKYRIVISPQDFNQLRNIAPIAEVQLDASGVVQSVTDARQMMFRLGSGGSVPNPLAVYSWPGGRTENPVTSTTTTDPFVGADKSIASFVDFFHAMESRLWEVGGGEHWYSQTSDRDVLFVRDPLDVFAGGENFEWTGTNLHWRGLSFDFGNSTAVRNTINQQLIDSPGLTDLAVGQCIYVDVNRAVDGAALVPVRANLATLGIPTIPGSRHIIAWRVTEGVFGLGQVTPVGFGLPHASTTAFGVVELFSSYVPDPANPIVPVVDAGGAVVARGINRDTNGALNLGTGATNASINIGATGIIITAAGPFNATEGLTATGAAGPALLGIAAGAHPALTTTPDTGAASSDIHMTGRATTPSTSAAGDVYWDQGEDAPYYQDGVQGMQQMGERAFLLTTDLLTTSSVPSAATGFAFDAAANRAYAFEITLFADTQDAAGWTILFNGPAAVTTFRVGTHHIAGSFALSTNIVMTNVAVGAATIYKIWGVLRNGNNAGTIQMQYSSNTGGGGNTTAIREGSYMTWRRLPPGL